MKIELEDTLPTVSVESKGEILLEGGKTLYKNWSSNNLHGKVRIIQHIAGKTTAKAMNESLVEAIKTAKFNKDHYQTTTIINLKDAIWGTGAIVAGKAESAKKEYSWSSIVLDDRGTVRKAWDLKKDSSAIILLDQSGKVVFAKEGKLSKDEISDLITDIDALLNQATVEQLV